jgi:peptidoglycan-associated lipoprotein
MKKIVSLILMGLLAACANQPENKATVEDRTAAQPAPAATTQPAQTSAAEGNPLKDPNNILSKRSVYYDFDTSSIKEEYRPIVAAHAKYLTQNRSAKILIQGNADERGSREYNLALGQRRADTVKNTMTVLGASESQIEAVSLGEEKPKATGHDEASWAENRRSDIIYRGE